MTSSMTSTIRQWLRESLPSWKIQSAGSDRPITMGAVISLRSPARSPSTTTR
jgi:hypothetical protein